jgi:hypothetical protein
MHSAKVIETMQLNPFDAAEKHAIVPNQTLLRNRP